MIIVDSSAWIEFLRRTGSPADRSVTTALQDDVPLGVVDVVRLEVLAGASTDAQLLTATRLLARGVHVPLSSPADHEYAAMLYRAGRRSGTTIRSLVDCLVAAAAVRLDIPVLAQDRDFDALAGLSALRLSGRPTS